MALISNIPNSIVYVWISISITSSVLSVFSIVFPEQFSWIIPTFSITGDATLSSVWLGFITIPLAIFAFFMWRRARR